MGFCPFLFFGSLAYRAPASTNSFNEDESYPLILVKSGFQLQGQLHPVCFSRFYCVNEVMKRLGVVLKSSKIMR